MQQQQPIDKKKKNRQSGKRGAGKFKTLILAAEAKAEAAEAEAAAARAEPEAAKEEARLLRSKLRGTEADVQYFKFQVAVLSSALTNKVLLQQPFDEASVEQPPPPPQPDAPDEIEGHES